MTYAAPDLNDDEWLLRRLPPPQHQFSEKDAGGFYPQSASFSATQNGGISFDRALTIIRDYGSVGAYPLPNGFALAAIKVKHLRGQGLTLQFTDPPPHHVEAFGLRNLSNGVAKRVQKALAKAALFAVWPSGVVTWPPQDREA